MSRIKGIFGFLSLDKQQRLYFYAIVVGVIAGFVAILFEACLNLLHGYLFSELGNSPVTHPYGEEERVLVHFATSDAGPVKWFLLILPAVGGLISGWLVYRFAPEAAGTGTDAMIDAFHNKTGKISALVPFIKGVTTIITLATGGSSGKEGPVAQIGAGLGSSLAVKLGLGVRDRRTLLLAGTAAGLGAIFQAPLGGAITAVEVLYHEDIESDALIPCVISSVTAYAIFGSIYGFSHIFYLPGAESLHFVPSELFIFIILGLVCSLIGYIYVKVFYGLKKVFERLNCPIYLKPAIGGLAVGILGYSFPEVMGSGFGFVQDIMKVDSGMISWTLVGTCLILIFLKILATSFTVSSGGSGGVFAPSLFIGSMIGAVVGGVAYLIMPGYLESPFGAFVVVGMSSFFAGVAHAPIAAVIMISEMTGGYELLAPLMLVSVLAIIISKKWSIYENQVKNKFFSKAHVKDMTIDVLQNIKVKSLGTYRQVGIISSHTMYPNAINFAQKIHASDLVLVDHDDVFAGIVSLRDVHFDNSDPFICSLVTLEDIMTKDIPCLTPDHNLHEALEVIMQSEFDKVPILSDLNAEEGRLLGYVLYSDILGKYHEIVGEQKETYS